MIDEAQLRYASSYHGLTALECMTHLQHNRVATGLIDFTYIPLADGAADGKAFVANIQSDKAREIKIGSALAISWK